MDTIVTRKSQDTTTRQIYNSIACGVLGYLADDMMWCGQEEAPGINYDYCLTEEECDEQGGPDTSELAYWKAMSIEVSAFSLNGNYQYINNSYHP